MPVGFRVLRSPNCVIVFDKRYVPLTRSCLKIHWQNSSLSVGWCSVHSCVWQFPTQDPKSPIQSWSKPEENIFPSLPQILVTVLQVLRSRIWLSRRQLAALTLHSQTWCREVSWDLQPFSNQGPALAIFG